MRSIKYIAVHCTAGNLRQTVSDLQHEFRRKGWKNPGYHYVITQDGVIHQLLDEAKVSNGVQGYNSCTVNVAYTGGVDMANGMNPVDNRTPEQKKSLLLLLRKLRRQYPNAAILGHRDFPGVRKACPSFDAREEYREV